MFFRFPPDARWNPHCSVVEFGIGIGIGEYEGVVRVSRRVFQILLPQAPTPERCLEAYHLHRTRLEIIAERKVRRRQLTDDGNVEITGRDLRERGSPGNPPTPHRVSPGRSMRAAQQAARDAERRFPVRVRIAVPLEGLGNRLDQIVAWLDANCGADGWTSTPSSTRGVVNEALAVYFLDATIASAFVARWCAAQRIEILDGVYRVRDDEPKSRVGAGLHKTP
jgi:hypothetical protein